MHLANQIKIKTKSALSSAAETYREYKDRLLLLYIAIFFVPEVLAASPGGKGPAMWIGKINDVATEGIKAVGNFAILFGLVFCVGGMMSIKRGTKEQGTQQGVYYVGGVISFMAGLFLLYLKTTSSGAAQDIFGATSGGVPANP